MWNQYVFGIFCSYEEYKKKHFFFGREGWGGIGGLKIWNQRLKFSQSFT